MDNSETLKPSRNTLNWMDVDVFTFRNSLTDTDAPRRIPKDTDRNSPD